MPVTVKKEQVVGLLVAMGFSKAPDWDDSKLQERIVQIPSKVGREDVPGEYQDFYDALEGAGEDGVVFDADGATGDGTPAKAKGSSKKAPAKAKGSSKKAPAKEEPKASAKSASKKAPVKKAPAKEKPKAPKKEREVDAYGAAIGTIRARVNGTFSSEWKTDADVAKESGVTLRQARIRLRRAVKAGTVEVQRTIAYRLVKGKK